MNPRFIWWSALVMGLVAQTMMAQPGAGSLGWSPAPDHTNLILQISSQPGFFYTLQESADLSQWASDESVYADNDAVTWTNPLSALAGQAFFRARADLPNTAVETNYHSWSNVVWLNNGIVEAVIVPNAGRVMQLRFLGSTNGPFWEDRILYGQNATPTSWNTEGGFGGDKAWPAPQSAWPWAGNWPPPSGFDGSTNACGFTNGIVTLTTPVDSTYKIRTSRIIELVFGEPVMRIRTIFERVSATTLTNYTLANWVITQVQDPVRIYVPVPTPSIFSSGYYPLGTGLPTLYRYTNGLISFTRDTATSHKLGFDANSLAWVGTNLSLRIDAPRVAGLPRTSYPDGGCNTEVYTNPGAPYCELECLGPLSKLPVGGTMEFVTTYTLFHRTETDPDHEARKILNLP